MSSVPEFSGGTPRYGRVAYDIGMGAAGVYQSVPYRAPTALAGRRDPGVGAQ